MLTSDEIAEQVKRAAARALHQDRMENRKDEREAFIVTYEQYQCLRRGRGAIVDPYDGSNNTLYGKPVIVAITESDQVSSVHDLRPQGSDPWRPSVRDLLPERLPKQV